MSYMAINNKYLWWVESDGQWRSEQQSLEDLFHVKVWGLNLPLQTHWAPWFWIFSMQNKKFCLSVMITVLALPGAGRTSALKPCVWGGITSSYTYVDIINSRFLMLRKRMKYDLSRIAWSLPQHPDVLIDESKPMHWRWYSYSYWCNK